MNKIKVTGIAPVLVGVFLTLAGCASDYAKINGFHDPSLEKGSTVVDFLPGKRKSLFGGNADVWSQGFELPRKGLGKVYVRTPNLTVFTGKDGYKPAYYNVSVNSASAKTLKWEIWSSAGNYQMHSKFGSSALQFQKIMGPFKEGEVVKVDYLEGSANTAWGHPYIARTPLIVVYSAADPGAKYTIDLHKSVLAN